MPKKRFLFVVNPVSGKRRALVWAKRAQAQFEDNLATVDSIVLQRAGHATELAGDLDLTGYAGLCVLGGDGTIHELVNGLRQRNQPIDIPIGLIACGTGNSLHNDLGLLSPSQGIDRILAGGTRQLDMMRVGLDDRTVYCVHMIGWGSVASIAHRAARIRWAGFSRYNLAAFVEIFLAKQQEARIVVDQGSVDEAAFDGKFMFAIGCNTQFVGSGMRMAPNASVSDGLFDLFVIKRASRFEMLQLFLRVHSGSHTTMACLEHRQVRSLSIETERPFYVNLDGDVPPQQCQKLDVEIMPNTLMVFA